MVHIHLLSHPIGPNLILYLLVKKSGKFSLKLGGYVPIKQRKNGFGGKISRVSLLKIVQRGQVYAVCGEGTPRES